MLKITLALVVGFAAAAPVAAQDFNYVPGWANTYNHSRIGEPAEPRELQPCRFDMLSRSEQRRLQNLARAKVREVGEEAAMPWINRQSDDVIAQMVEAGKCRGN
jgi:hypothetical protein